MPVTAKEIASKLGLTQPTVSRILNGSSTYRVSAQTRQRVVEAARQMGYRPNAIARSLRHGRTNIVGFYSGYGCINARGAYLASLLGGLQRACDLERLDILMHGVFRGRSTDDLVGELTDGRIDGLLLHSPSADPLVPALSNSALPVVALTDELPGLPSVCADDERGAEMAITYLLKQGHRNIAYIAPKARYISVERRVKTYCATMSQAGLSPRMVRISHEDTSQALGEFLSCSDRWTAACCWNDVTAADMVHGCRRLGIGVPGDLAIVGFDGSLDDRIMGQRITTMSVSWEEFGERAIGLLKAQIDKDPAQLNILVDVQLVLGTTA